MLPSRAPSPSQDATRRKRVARRGAAGPRALGVVGVLALSLAVSTPTRADGSITPPRPLSSFHVEYPDRASGEQDVLLELTVDADGSVEKARVVEGQTPFSDAALAAAKGFRFTPAREGDRPVRARIRARIHFTPPPPPAPEPAPGPVPAGPRALEVQVSGDPRAPGAIQLGRAEVRVLPGAFGDPFRAIEALPGLVPATAGAPYFYVRGAPPGNVGYFLDGIRLPALFHILVGPAVLPPALIDRVELFPGGYPAQYGRFAGGVLTATTRPPTTELHAEGTLRLIDAGGFVETPLPGGGGSALLGGRYSYTSPALSLFTSNLRFNYWDYQARLTLDLSARERLTLFLFGSHDDMERNSAGTWRPLYVSDVYRVDLRYDGSLGEGTKITHGFTLGRDRTTGSLSSYEPSSLLGGRNATPTGRDISVAARSRISTRLSNAVLLRAGADATLDSYTSDSGDIELQVTTVLPSRLDLSAGLFVDSVIALGRGVEITPGVRLDLWSSAGHTALSADPRFAARFPLGDRARLLETVGLAHQAPGFVVPIPGVAIAGLEGGLQRSVQTSHGVEVDLPLSFRASGTFFYNAFFNLSDPFGVTAAPQWADWSAPSLLRYRVRGSAVGLELHVERKLTERLGGFLSATFSRSNRVSWRNNYPARSDRTLVLQGALSWNIGHGFRVGGRGSFLSGRPLSPFFDRPGAKSVWGREPPSYRLDARAEKRWTIGKRGYVSLVLEMLNVTLAKDPDGLDCYSQPGCRVVRTGPVTMPSIGVEGGL
jgi:TonB family protein